MKKLIFTSLVALLLVSWHLMSSSIEEVVEAIKQYHESYPQEKIYLHTDKPYYVLGETIWFKAYGTLATSHVPLIPSGLVYVSLIDNAGNILATRYIHIIRGCGTGDILIDPNWKISGTLTLRAHTNYNLNFDTDYIFQKEINVYDSYQTIVSNQKTLDSTSDLPGYSGVIKLSFYPEGGELVENLSSTIGVHATNEKGKGIAIKAKVFDRSNNLKTLFITNGEGLGFFNLQPGEGKSYKVEAIFKGKSSTFNIPQAQKFGTTLAIKPYRPDTLAVIIQSTVPDALSGAHLIGHIRGDVFSKINVDEVGNSTFIIPTGDLQAGIAHFTLFNREVVPLAERLVFINTKPSSQHISIDFDREHYTRKQNGSISLQFETGREDSLLAFGSLSIHDQLLANRPVTDIDILSYLLLTSDLPGVIENPGFYFQNGQVVHDRELDLVMLTHGWRRFLWKDILASKVINLQYLPENGFTISGQTTRIVNDKGVKSNVFLSTLDQNFSMAQTISNAEGYFVISGLQFNDTTTLLIQSDRYSEKDKGKKEGPGKDFLNINLDSEYQFNDIGIPSIPAVLVDPENLNKFLSESRYNNQVNHAYENLWSIDLDEITVTSEKVQPAIEYHKNAMLYKDPDNRLYIDSIPAAHSKLSIFDAIKGRVPGMEVFGSYPNQNVRIRGYSSISLNTTATILLDGVPISVETANSISPERIAFVDVLKSLSNSALYGSSGNGVVAIYTKSPDEMKGKYSQKNGALRINHPGYYHAREFFSPNYTVQEPGTDVDYRTTLLWQPDITFTKDQSAIKIPFSTSDRTSVYQMMFQGITTDGEPISKVIHFQVE